MAKFRFHFQFWVVYITLISALISIEGNFSFSFYWMHFLLDLPAVAILAYPLIYWIYPMYRKRNVYLLSGLTIGLVVVASMAKIVTTQLLFYNLYLPNVLAPDYSFSLQQLVRNIFWVILPSGLLLSMQFYRSWMILQKERAELLRHRLEAELQMLKSQLNPHFLFNVLNNLYALALIKSDKTPKLIACLSNLFEYMLYQSHKSIVSLGEELDLLQAYVDLQEMKYGDRINVSIQYDKSTLNRKVAPLLLFPFVENCYKHGCSNDPGNPTISIQVTTHNDTIICTIENSKPGRMADVVTKKHGIGIKNTLKRLEILYPQRHYLDVDEDDHSFKIELQLVGEPLNKATIEKYVNIKSNLVFN